VNNLIPFIIALQRQDNHPTLYISIRYWKPNSRRLKQENQAGLSQYQIIAVDYFLFSNIAEQFMELT